MWTCDADVTTKQEHTTLPVSRQRLLFRGQLMKNADSLDTLHVDDGDTLLLIARPVAAPVQPSPVTMPQPENAHVSAELCACGLRGLL